MMKIGVFWVYRGAVFGKARPISEGQEGVKGLVDSPDDHVTVWEGPNGYRQNFPELRSVESLNRPAVRELIAYFFGFDPNIARWMSDIHYTTHPAELEDIFSDDN